MTAMTAGAPSPFESDSYLARHLGADRADTQALLDAVGAASMEAFLADAVPAALPGAATVVGRALLGADVVPRYSDDLPAGGHRRRVIADDPGGPFATQAVWFSSCTNTMFGHVQPELGTDAGLGAAEDTDLGTTGGRSGRGHKVGSAAETGGTLPGHRDQASA